jgi:hypothetical protein
MTNDTPLKGIPVVFNDLSWQQFNDAIVPRIVLFKKSNGVKGAIRIKQFVQNEQQSYVIVDIKVQKEP